MHTVSACCLQHVETGQKVDFFDKGFPKYMGIEWCTGCGKEVEDTVDVWECCGLERCCCEGDDVRRAG